VDEQLYYAPCGYFVMKIDGFIMEANKWLGEMLGIDRREIIGTHIHSILTRPSKLYFQTYFTPIISTHKRVNEMYLTLKLATERLPVLVNATVRKNRIECVMLQMNVRDEYENELISAKRKAEEIVKGTDKAFTHLQQLMKEVEEKKEELITVNKELEKHATTDPLTGLKNRRYLQERMGMFLASAQKDHTPFSLLLVDIDHFKYVNDTFGHPVGDQMLQELAWKLEQESREADSVVRLGGEEFVILLAATNGEQATQIAERLRATIENYDWPHSPITVSIGATTYKNGDRDSTLLARVDRALYVSKNNGRNRVSLS